MMKNKYLNGFIVGGLIGAATAMMVSSRSDHKFSKKMMDGGKNIADAATRLIPGIKSR